jgi:hypothetical protein
MRKSILLLLCLAVSLFAGVQDTLYTVRVKPGKPEERTVMLLFVPGYSVSYNSLGGMIVSCRTLCYNQDSTRWDTTEYAPRFTNADTSYFGIVYTTDYDSIPKAYRSGEWILNAQGKFERK